MSEFYRSFEDRFRGSQEEIARRLRQYEPFVRPIAQAKLRHRAIDLGCGRGEWLGVLAEFGQAATGVDLDTEMLRAAQERGFDVQTADALQYLRQQPDSSTPIITAFHLVEHLPFNILQELVHEAYRCLMPGGLIILETPNPENLIVSSTNFYLDPTHVKPIPPMQLSFVVENAGFSPVKIVRLQEQAQLADCQNPSLMNVLDGASPDYSVVAQKPGNDHLLTALSEAFGRTFGLELSTLANRYDQSRASGIRTFELNTKRKFRLLDDDMRAMQKNMNEMQERIALLNSKVEYLNSRPARPSLRRREDVPRGPGRQDKVENSGMANAQVNPILAQLKRRLRRLVASWFSDETKQVYKLLLAKLNTRKGAILPVQEEDLSPQAAYFRDRLLAGPMARKDL